MHAHIGLRRAPVERDKPCPVCTGLISARTETALVLDMLAPGAMPVPLVSMHALCFNALSLTTADVLACRERPRGPSVDSSGAIVHIAEGVHFRVTGVNRTAVAEAIREAVATFKRGKSRDPIVAFVRRTVTADPNVAPLLLRVNETAGPPPHVRQPSDPAMIVSFETGSPDKHKAIIGRFAFVPGSGVAPSHPRYNDAVSEMHDFIRQRATAFDGPAMTEDQLAERIASDLAQLPRVTNVRQLRDGRWTVVVDPNRAVPRAAGGVTTSAPPPTGNFAGPQTPGAPARPWDGLSPNLGGDNARDASPGQPQGAPASGGQLPPPGEVTRPMLEPLDTPEQLAARPAICDSILTGLRGAFPKAGIAKVTVDRDKATFAEVVTVALQRRVQTESASMLAESFRGHLRSRVASWASLEAAGLSLTVVDLTPPERPDGNELPDEVNLRSLPKCPRTNGTTTAIGKNVAFRAPLWKAIFADPYAGDGNSPGPDQGMYVEQLKPYEGELARIRAKLTKLLEGYEPEFARKGVLTGYDAVTDHAVVTVAMPKGDIHIHTSLSWTMEWNVPAPVTAHKASVTLPPGLVTIPKT